jgi:hypothetical protein
MSLWKKVTKSASEVGKGALQVAQAPLYPVAYIGGLQQGGWKGGERAVTGLADSPEDFWNSPQNRSMMALTAAEIAAIAATGGLATGAIGGGTMATATGATLTASEAAAVAGLTGVTATSASGLGIAGAIGAGSLAMAAGYGVTAIGGGSAGGEGAPPPDINEANDPATAAQFQRIRKAARMLGRAGTIKNKSAKTLGGGADGEQTLGTQLAVA